MPPITVLAARLAVSGAAPGRSTTTLDLPVAAEEELGVLLAKHPQAPIGHHVITARHGRVGSDGTPLTALIRSCSASVVAAATKVNPRPCAQERRRQLRPIGSSRPASSTEKTRLGGGAIKRDVDLLALPRAQVMRSHENRAGPRRTQPGGELTLPRSAGRQRPLVKPRLDPRALQALRDPLHNSSVAAVVGQGPAATRTAEARSPPGSVWPSNPGRRSLAGGEDVQQQTARERRALLLRLAPQRADHDHPGCSNIRASAVPTRSRTTSAERWTCARMNAAAPSASRARTQPRISRCSEIVAPMRSSVVKS